MSDKIRGGESIVFGLAQLIQTSIGSGKTAAKQHPCRLAHPAYLHNPSNCDNESPPSPVSMSR